MKDRRVHERFSASGSIKIAKVEHAEQDLHPAQIIAGSLVDLSESGAGILLEKEVEPGEIVCFVEMEPGWKYSEKAQVMWTAESSEGFRVGVMFL